MTRKQRLEDALVLAISNAPRDPKWVSGRFSAFKSLSNNHKEEVSLALAEELCRETGVSCIRKGGRIGDWDLEIKGFKVEVKSASEDTSGNFQFNGVRTDRAYDKLLLIGISPNEVGFKVYAKPALMSVTLTPMSRGTAGSYKLVEAGLNALLSITEFAGEVRSW